VALFDGGAGRHQQARGSARKLRDRNARTKKGCQQLAGRAGRNAPPSVELRIKISLPMEHLDSPAKPKPRPGAVARAPALVAAPSPLYRPAIALDFFRSSATMEEKPAGKPFFSENEKADGLFSKSARMYLLLEGDISLTIRKKFFGVVKAGDVFGELGVIAGLPRSATAMAMINCRVLSLDKKQFQAALEKKPEFALMLMSIMVQRLRQSIAKLGTASPVVGAPAKRSDILERKALAELWGELGLPEPAVFQAGKVIMSAGAAGAFMYVVLEGRVDISVGERVVEHVGPGGILGELALVDRSARAATATAQTDCRLLVINRNDFINLVKSKPAFGASLLKSIALRMHQLALQVARMQA
jgi:CRP/FNR family transcriptional regulator, cyclic AMP receptor protein